MASTTSLIFEGGTVASCDTCNSVHGGRMVLGHVFSLAALCVSLDI